MANRCDEDIFIGKRLTMFREIMNIKRKDMAKVMHITEDSLYRIEHGDKGLSGTYAYILAKEYHCDMNFIFGLTDIPRIITDTEYTSPDELARVLRCYAYFLEHKVKE